MEVIVRRLDQLFWDFNVSIFVRNLPSESQGGPIIQEILDLGTSRRCDKRVLLKTAIDLAPDDSIDKEQLIPKVVVQTYSTRAARSVFQINAHQTFVDLNPEYQVNMFTDRDCRLFLKKYFSPSVVEAYDILIAPSFKADVFRYAYLALRGGCYFDHKMILRRPLRSVIGANDSLLVCSDALVHSGAAAETLSETKRLYNAVICSAKQEPRMWRTLAYVIQNIYRRHSVGSDLSLTGPIAFYEAIAQNLTENELRFKHGFFGKGRSLSAPGKRYQDYFVKEKVSDGLFLTKHYKDFVQDPGTKYGNLWRSQIIYYELLGKYGAWKMYTYPGQRQCLQPKFDSSHTITLQINQDVHSFHQGNMASAATAPSPSSMTFFQLPLSVCHQIKLYLVNDDTSETHRIDVPQDQSALVTQYTLPFSFAT
eukprot:gene6078-4366_t